MSGLNRLFVPDLGDQANLMPLYQSRQADVSAWRDGRRSRPGMQGKEERKEGEVEGEREVCRAAVMGGEGAPCLHFVWNEEQDEGCVKDSKEGQRCWVFFYFCMRVYLCHCVCRCA